MNKENAIHWQISRDTVIDGLETVVVEDCNGCFTLLL